MELHLTATEVTWEKAVKMTHKLTCVKITPESKPFEGVRDDPFSFAGVPCGDDLSSLAVRPPRPRRLIGLREGGFGSEGSVGLTGGGPGVVSSMMWAHILSNLTAHIQIASLPHCMQKKLHTCAYILQNKFLK